MNAIDFEKKKNSLIGKYLFYLPFSLLPRPLPNDCLGEKSRFSCGTIETVWWYTTNTRKDTRIRQET